MHEYDGSVCLPAAEARRWVGRQHEVTKGDAACRRQRPGVPHLELGEEHASDVRANERAQLLCGTDHGATPVEFLLHALASCLTAGIANIASMRGVTLTAVESTVEGEIDLQGIFGMSSEVRNGYQQIRASFHIEGDAPAETLRAIVEQSRARSAVFDVLTRGVPVELSIDAG